MSPRYVPVLVRLLPGQVDALRALSKRTRVRQAEYLREAIDWVLRRYPAGVAALAPERYPTAEGRDAGVVDLETSSGAWKEAQVVERLAAQDHERSEVLAEQLRREAAGLADMMAAPERRPRCRYCQRLAEPGLTTCWKAGCRERAARAGEE